MPDFSKPLYQLFGLGMEDYGGYDAPLDKAGAAPFSVIGLGLPRTGTKSLAEALEILGMRPVFQPVDLVRQPAFQDAWIDTCKRILGGSWKAGDPALNNRLRSLHVGYRSSTDHPAPHMVREMYAAFPEAKYILGLRRTPGPDKNGVSASANVWWDSMWNAVRPAISQGWDRTFYRAIIYPVRWMRRTDDFVQLGFDIHRKELGGKPGVEIGAKTYDMHSELVRRVIPADQLLEFDAKDGWEPLCKFLDLPIPNEPFPRKNERERMQAIWFAFQVYGLAVWCTYLGAAAGVGWLAMNPEAGKGLARRAIAWCSNLVSKVW